MRVATFRTFGWAALAALLAGCGGESGGDRHPWVVIGVDGMEWKVIEQMWQESRLPALRSLADDGSRSVLLTDYTASPVIWTTIATGVNPRRHGIVDFVVPTGKGDVPVSSRLRKAPAIWELASEQGMRVGVLGWWASWPAESINGPVVSDRCLQTELEDRVAPAGLLGLLEEDLAALEAESNRFGGNESSSRRDAVMAAWGERWAADELDLLLVYFRSVDITSHFHWKGFDPAVFPDLAPDEIEGSRGRVEAAYEAVDEAIGRIVEAAGPDSNILVISDHGFKAYANERLQIQVDLSRVLEELGFLNRGPDGIDFARTQVYPHASPNHRVGKLLRFARAEREPGGRVTRDQESSIRTRLDEAVQRLRWPGGEPAFRLRSASPREVRQGGDFVLEVLPQGAARSLAYEGREISGAVPSVSRLSGTHTRRTHGVLIARGPDLGSQSDAGQIRIHDVTPTLLYALGLPVADDLDGMVARHLFSSEFHRENPLRRVATFGDRNADESLASPVDEKLVDELRALGYLD